MGISNEYSVLLINIISFKKNDETNAVPTNKLDLLCYSIKTCDNNQTGKRDAKMTFEKLIEILQELTPSQFVALATAVSLIEKHPREQIEDDLLLLRRQIHDPLRQDVSLGTNGILPNGEAK